MTSERPVFLIMDKQEEKHDQPWTSYHIETSKRLDVIDERLQKSGLYNDPRIKHLPRREATEKEILSVHTKRYLNDVKATETMTPEEQEEFCTKYEDIFVNSATWKRAKLAAGSAIDLAISVSEKKSTGIAFIRPPGHHAMPDEGCGFCIFNNIAIAAKEVIRVGLAKKVMIVDYDVHAANGTQECIEGEEENVKLISIHRYENGTFWPNMPQTGIYHNYKNTMNLPLNTIGLSDSDYYALFTHIIIPSIHDFKPDLILVSSGFDASLGDPEGYMNVTPAGFATMIRLLMNTGVPVAAILEGGYFLDALAADSEWVLRALLQETLPSIKIEPLNLSIVDTIARVISKYEKTSLFFRKLQELRKLFGQNIERSTEDVTDYRGERIVHPPYETRGIYTPFSEEKIDSFRKQLETELKSYETIEKVSDNDQYIIKDESIGSNHLSLRNGKLLIGTGKPVNRFVDLLFISVLNPPSLLESSNDLEDIDFSLITFGEELKNLRDIPTFQHFPIFQL
uniref:Hist_deacetyl domain-containing protein n=1 Tax=Caenorhabditis tropicalis TaxID=1561998 RepID=A0A1I7TSG7_9PELO